MPKLIITLVLWLCFSQTQATEPHPAIDTHPFGWIFWQLDVLEDSNERLAPEKNWKTLHLPDSHRAGLREDNRMWYRLKIPDTLPVEFRDGVFIDRSLMNLEVYFNNDYLGSGGSVTDPTDRNWNQPHLFKIPTSSWQNHNNILYIQLIGSDGFSVVSPPAMVNYTQAKTDLYQTKQLIRIELSRFSFAVMLCIAVFCWLIWYQTRQLILLLLCLASLLWLVVLAYTYFRQFPLEHAIFVRVVHWCIEGCSMLLLLFARKKYHYSISKMVIPIVTYLIALGLLLAATTDVDVVKVANRMHIISQLVISYLIALTGYKYFHNRSASDLIFLLGLVLIMAFQIHDISLSLSTNWHRWINDAHIGHLSVPVLFILLCFSLSSMYKEHILTSEALNKHLEKRLTAAKTDLKQQLQDKEALATQQRVNEEREHVYRDIHDDLGAKLLSLVYASPEPHRNDLVRSALQDLRDVVSRNNNNEISLQELLTETLNEQQLRCEKLGVVLHTTFHGDSGDTTYSGHRTVLFKRLLRELVGLFIHNAEVPILRIDILVGKSGVEASVSGEANEAHIDTLSLKARATRIDCELQVLQEQSQQLQVVFWIPHQAKNASPIEGV